jgi:NhaA family Na+:H+ antiporter
LQLLLTALAIADDLLAIGLIAIFYTRTLDPVFLTAAGLVLLGLLGMNRLGVRSPLAYAIAGFALWLAVLYSGVHATIAGVLLAVAVPATTRLDEKGFLRRARTLVTRFARSRHQQVMKSAEQQAALQDLETAVDHVQPPLHRMEHAIQPWVGFIVMPLFALANTGVDLRGVAPAEFANPVTLGIMAGLVCGKPLGILLGSWLATRARGVRLPPQTGWRHLCGIAWLGGIGFTMSLFIAQLAFGQEQLQYAKVGILAGSLLAGGIGTALLAKAKHSTPPRI